MSTEKHTISVGILPNQTEDYSQFEEDELRWDRIIIAGVVILLIIVSLLYLVFSDKDAPSSIQTNSSIDQGTEKLASTIKEPIVLNSTKPVQEPSLESEPAVALLKAPLTVSLKETVEEQKTVLDSSPALNKSVTNPLRQALPKQAPLKPFVVKPVAPFISPLKIFNTHIKKAQLSSNIEKGLPVDELSTQILMSTEGIIKIHLYTEMEDLRGQYLFHVWYLNGEQQARVKIPVNHKHQRSSSSKFINRQMLGTWMVKVLDESDKLYIQADFEVVAP